MRTRTRNKKDHQYNYWRSNLCHSCLNSDKPLFKLGKFEEIFKFICRNIELDVGVEIHLCWICLAVLRKFKNLEEKVQNALNILQKHSDDKLPPECLSGFTIYSSSLEIDCEPDIKTEESYVISEVLQNDEEKCVKAVHEDEKKDFSIGEDANADNKISEVVKEYVVKEEPNSISDEEMNGADDVNTFDDDDEPIDELKLSAEECSESLAQCMKPKIELEKKKIKKKRQSLKYRVLFKNGNGNIMKTKAIDYDELNAWLEKERNSDYFQNLKNKCEICISKVSNLREHKQNFHNKPKRNHLCSICQRIFKSKIILDSHITSHFHINYCGECGYQCYTKHHLKDHIKVHMKIVVCNECETRFENRAAFYSHYKDLHSKFICDYCNSNYRKKRFLENHITRRHLARVCPCKLSFKSYTTYKYHMSLKHDIDRSENTFCVQCNKQFITRQQFLSHCYQSAAHAKERPTSRKPQVKPRAQCPACPKIYGHKCNMRYHFMKEHAKEYRFYCTLCEKAFLTKPKLRDHMLYFHEGKKKPKNKICELCGKGFSVNRLLIDHIRTHTGEKPYKCSYCEATFAQPAARGRHENYIHMKKKRGPSKKAIAKTLPSNVDEDKIE